VLRAEGRRLWVTELDAIDDTPIIDIKPSLREFLPCADVQQPEWSRVLMEDDWSVKG